MLLTPLSMAWHRGFLVGAFCHICKFHLRSELPAYCWLAPRFSEPCLPAPWWNRVAKSLVYPLFSQNRQVNDYFFPKILLARHQRPAICLGSHDSGWYHSGKAQSKATAESLLHKSSLALSVCWTILSLLWNIFKIIILLKMGDFYSIYTSHTHVN